MEEVRAEVDSAFDNYEFSRACEALYHFAWDEFCDWYVELAKVQLAEGFSTPPPCWPRSWTRCSLLHPVMPFVTETLWKTLTGGQSLVIADWPSRPVSGGSGCDSTHHRHAEAGDRGAAVPQRPGLNDRQKVPARLSDIAAADLDAQPRR